MIVQRISPASSVSNYIREYLLVHLVFNPQTAPPIKAYPVNPEEGITFQIKGLLSAEQPDLGITEKRSKTYFFGQPILRQNLHQEYEFMLVHVRFHPGCLFQLFKIPMTELLDKNIDAELILGHATIEEINDQLANAPNYLAIPPILDTFFNKYISKLKHDVQPVDTIGRMILANPQNFNLDRTAKAACLSHRQFERRFVNQLGVPPKHYARICRFYEAYILKDTRPELNWQDIAFDTGYTDYQHLVKDFKQFAGTSPNILLEQTYLNPERRLNISNEFKGL